MSRIKGRPSSGAFLRSSRQLEQIGFLGSPGRGNSFAITPSYSPLCSTNRNQLTGLPVSPSIFCQRPLTDGSVAAELAAAPSANNPAKEKATSHLLDCTVTEALYWLSNQLNTSAPMRTNAV